MIRSLSMEKSGDQLQINFKNFNTKCLKKYI